MPPREFVGRNVPILLRPLEEKAERVSEGRAWYNGGYLYKSFHITEQIM
jgi:hypothetical protein